MKTKFIAATLTLVIGALTAAPAALGQGTWEKEFEVDPGQKIELRMKHGGSLDVESWERDSVSIVCEARMNDIDDWDIDVTETRGGLRLVAELNDRSINSNNFVVTLRVPREFDIATSSGGGHIRIEGVSGEFTGKSAGGGITLKDVKGDADLTTGGGWIEIEDSDLDGRVRSGGGGGIVRDVTGNVKVSSGGGAVSYENVRDGSGELRGPRNTQIAGATARTIIQVSNGGEIDLDSAPEGAYVKTGGGDVDISGASRFVRASTGGGDMDIEIEDGWVQAQTGAGDVDIIVSGDFGDGSDGIKVVTGYGEVTVTIPADASVEFDLDLSYTRNSSQSFDIDCDFDLDVEHTKKWDKSHGTPRKHILGTATINGGKHLVKIRNTNGDIKIRKR
ncbi:MAG: DUF4097 domain-containing protein [bacterium]|nr:DUF4097 domain-containing protein [bacterium]